MRVQRDMWKLSFVTVSFILACFVYPVLGQQTSGLARHGRIGISFSSFGKNYVIHFARLNGSAGYSPDHFFMFGVNYIYPVNDWACFETGLQYAGHTVIVNPNLPPGMDDSPFNTKFSFMSVPLTFRAEFLKFFFINGGSLLDVATSWKSKVDEQTGLGLMVGIAAKYDFNFGGSVFINPYSSMHTILPFTFDGYHERVWESGIRFGISYKL